MRKSNVRKMMKNATVKTVNVVETNTTESLLAQTVINGSTTVCGKRIAAVPVSLLRIDKSYQREPKGDSIQNLIKEWDMNSCDFLDVSFRDGSFYIIDGQHRYTAAKFIGVPTLPCIIRTGLTKNKEAIIFARQNRNVKKLYPYDTYKANVECADISYPEVRVDMEIDRICKTYNIEVKKMGGYTKGNKILRSLSRARDIVSSNGSDCFEWIIKTICLTNWENCSLSYSKEILSLLKSFYIENKDNIDTYEDSVRKVMNSITPMQLISMSRANYSEYSVYTALNICFKKLIDSNKTQSVKVVSAS